jgi:hypothetical protein
MKIMRDIVNQNERGATMPMKSISNYKDVGGNKISRGTFNVVERVQDNQQFYQMPVERKDFKSDVLNGLKIKLLLSGDVSINNYKQTITANLQFTYDKDYRGSPLKGYPAEINFICNAANSKRNAYSETIPLYRKSEITTPIEISFNDIIKGKIVINCILTLYVYGYKPIRTSYNLSVPINQ